MRDLIRRWVLPFVDPRRLLSVLRIPGFFLEWRAYRARAIGETVRLVDTYPCVADRTLHTPFDPHYFYQGAWLARRVAAFRPSLHVDIGSSILTMSVLSSQVHTVVADYRPLRATVSGLIPLGADVTRLPFADASLASVSSLHVVEHVGLGRYGDPLDPDGTRNAARELARIVKPGGRLYLSVPVGRERVCFNAHRVLAPRSVAAMFAPLALDRFSLVDDDGRFNENASLEGAARLEYGCGMFEFVKPGV